MKDGFSSTGSAFGSLCRDRFGQQVLWSEVRTLGLLGAAKGHRPFGSTCRPLGSHWIHIGQILKQCIRGCYTITKCIEQQQHLSTSPSNHVIAFRGLGNMLHQEGLSCKGFCKNMLGLAHITKWCDQKTLDMFRHTRPDSHKAIATRSSKASFGQRHLPPQQVVSCETPRDGTENLRRKFATKSSHLSASRRLTSNDLDTEFSPATALQNMKALEGRKQSKQLAYPGKRPKQCGGLGGSCMILPWWWWWWWWWYIWWCSDVSASVLYMAPCQTQTWACAR